MKESNVESKLKNTLEAFGFQVLKLTTPGSIATMDRLIIMPLWAPDAPALCEIKKPGKVERLAQETRRDDWRRRGVRVLDMVSTLDEVQELVDALLCEAVQRYLKSRYFMDLPSHIQNAYETASYRVHARRVKEGFFK